jgi:mono/diheme cytochrome c family protein
VTNIFQTSLALALFAACGDDDGSDPSPPGEEAGASATGGSSSDAGAGGAPPTPEGGAGGEGADPELAYGKYLVDHLIACPDCHTPRNAVGAPIPEQYMAGTECLIALETGECLHAPNLTNDETGLKNRTNDEIKTMITEGVRPTATDDEPLHPIMPYYVFANMNAEELDAIVRYLRTIPAVENAIPRSDDVFAVPAPVNPIDPDTIPLPAEDYPAYDNAIRGRYLATHVAACMECHTPHEMGPDVLDPEKYFSGGEAFPIGLPADPVSKNLTSDPETGLGEWEVEDIVRVLKEGVDINGDGICPPMPVGPMGAYGGLTDEDARDIAHYLKSLPAIENEVVDQCTWPPM